MSDNPPAPRRYRARKIALWVVGLLLGVPLVLVAAVLLLTNIDAGKKLIEREAKDLTGGQVVLSGLSGRFPDALRLAHVEIFDSKGVWLSADGVRLDWSPLALFGRQARIDLASIDRLSVLRAPVASPEKKPMPQRSGGFSLPVSVSVGRIAVASALIGETLAGRDATLKLEGSGRFASLDDAAATIAIDRLDAAGTYRLDATISASGIAARLNAGEPAGGLLSGLAKLPDLGAIAVDASIAGPRAAERATLKASAGALNASAQGTIDLTGEKLSLDVLANAPAMRPKPDLAWESVDVRAHMAGPFKTPDATAHAVLEGFAGGGARLARLTADIFGNQGAVDLHAVLEGLVVPGAKPDLFAAAPLDFAGHADLATPDRPVRFALRHKLVSADGTASLGTNFVARVHVTVPDLAPLAAAGNADIRGNTEAVASLARHGGKTDIAVDGTAAFTGGQAPLPALLGDTRYGVTASLDGQNIFLSRADVNGRALRAAVTGSDLAGLLDFAWQVAISDLAGASQAAKGQAEAHGRVHGKQGDLSVEADISGDVGTAHTLKEPVAVSLRATGLPVHAAGTVSAQGSVAGSKLVLSAEATRAADGALHAVLQQAEWKSAKAEADLVLPPGASVPTGEFSVKMTRLADLSALLGQAIAGNLAASVVTSDVGGHPQAKIDFSGLGFSAANSKLGRFVLTGIVTDPAGAASVDLTATADGLSASGVTGRARATAKGSQNALALRADANILLPDGSPATLATAALLDVKSKHISLQTLAADAKTLQLRLRAPAKIAFGDGLSVDQLRLALNQATLDVAGRISPTLSVTAKMRNVTPDLAKPFAPNLSAEGVMTADAQLSGTTAEPKGSVRVQASGFRLRRGPGASVPPASMLATLGMDGGTARLDSRLDAGPKLHLTANGTAGFRPGAALAMRMGGRADLTLLDPILGAAGRRAAGTMTVDASAGGTIAAPKLSGNVTLARGEIEDFVQGVHLTDIGANFAAEGDTVRVQNFSAKAGPGTIAVSGTVGVLAPELPVDLHVVANNARPLASDRLTASLDADFFVRGQASAELDAVGKIFVRRADINIPDSLPPSVAVLDVRRPGDKPPPPPRSTPPSVVRLSITIDAPSNIFVRGHGLDSELGGTLTLAGTANAPQIGGGFQLRRGDFSLAGTTLEFSKGEIGFDGTSVTQKIDPTLDFSADSTSGGVTATLAITGYADAPKIALSSSPSLPQDEVLAHLLFGQSMKDLSPLQIAEIAAALGELTGVTGGGGGPLATVRKGLGLDRLSVGGGSSGAGATVEAGRYVARGVYVGAKQATSGGGGTTAQVQIDLTRRLKLKAQVAAGASSVQGATPENDTGTTLGLSYQFEY